MDKGLEGTGGTTEDSLDIMHFLEAMHNIQWFLCMYLFLMVCFNNFLLVNKTVPVLGVVWCDLID